LQGCGHSAGAGGALVEHARGLARPGMDHEVGLAGVRVERRLHAQQHRAHEQVLRAPDTVGATKLQRGSHLDGLVRFGGEPVIAQADGIAARKRNDRHAL
jgi:hypothetical protein